MNWDKDKIKESLTIDQISEIMFELGSNPPRKMKDAYAFQTICHQGKSHKLYYYENNYTFYCYTECGAMDIYEVVLRAKRHMGVDLSFGQAVAFVANIAGIKAGSFYSNSLADFARRQTLINDWDWISKFTKLNRNTQKPVCEEINDNILQIFSNLHHSDWLNEGITNQTMEKYEIGYYGKDNAITIPHRDIDGRLIGIRKRNLNKKEVELGMKYTPVRIQGVDLSHKLGWNLYGLYQNKDVIRKLGKVVLWEAEKSVLKMDAWYPDNNFSVSLCGSNLTSEQITLLLSLGIREVIIGLDKQFEDCDSKAAQLWAKKNINMALRLAPYFQVFVIWDSNNLLDYKDAPCDKTKEILETLMRDKIEIKSGDEVLIQEKEEVD